MRAKQVWKKWVPVTLLLALASFGTMGFTSVDRGNLSPAITADHDVCAIAGAVDLPSDVLAEICAASHELTWLTGASDIPLDVINEIRFLTTFDVRPSVRFDQDSWEYARAFEYRAMSEGLLTTSDVSPSVNYDQSSWEYARAFEEHAMSEGR